MRRAPLVLGVDDNQLNLELLAEFLADTGCDLVTANDGESALELIQQLRPDLVLLDVRMPGLDGFEVCRRIRSSRANRFLPIVLVTSLSDVSDRIRALEAGADDFISKPIDRNELMARVLTLIRTREVYDHLDGAEQVMAAFARIVEAKDSGTEGHVERVARAARALGEAAGLAAAALDNLYFGGMIHDIGKISVPDSVLLKPGPLDAHEVSVMRRHVAVGIEIARELRSAAGLIPIIRHHHERFDGTGYPDGLRGIEIPEIAMIVSICDAYDAMTTDRPYRRAVTTAVALAELESCAGTQFDPSLMDLFLNRVVQAAATDSRFQPGPFSSR